MTSNTQSCSKCKIEQDLENFTKSRYSASGYRQMCRQCRNTHRTVIRKTHKHYQEMLRAQGNGCALCGKSEDENGQRLAIDHNHTTHQVRALLCRSCNTGIGAFKEDKELLNKAIEYINTWGEDDIT